MKVVNLADRAQPGRAHLGRPEQQPGYAICAGSAHGAL